MSWLITRSETLEKLSNRFCSGNVQTYRALYVREEAGTHRYSVGTDTPKLCATSSGAVPLANSFLAA
jgi:hypothetical protein